MRDCGRDELQYRWFFIGRSSTAVARVIADFDHESRQPLKSRSGLRGSSPRRKRLLPVSGVLVTARTGSKDECEGEIVIDPSTRSRLRIQAGLVPPGTTPHGHPAGLRSGSITGTSVTAGATPEDRPARSGGPAAARYAQRRRRRTPDFRAQRHPAPMIRQQSKITSVAAVVDNAVARRIGPGFRGRLRFRRLVEQRRGARLPGDHQRGADRHHRRRFSQRHLRLLQRRQGEPVRRPDEPRRGRGVAGDGRHSLPVGRGAGRHLRLPDRRSGGGADLHRLDHPRGKRGAAVLHAGRHRTAVRRGDARLDRRGPAGGDRLGGGLGQERAGAHRRQDGFVARWNRPYRLPLVRRYPRGHLPAALQRGQLPGEPALGPAGRRLARGAVPEPVLPARLADPAHQHARLPQGRLAVERAHRPERRRLLPSQPGPRRLAAALHRGRGRRRGRPGVGADRPPAGAGRRAAPGCPLRGRQRRCRRTRARLRILLHLQLLRLWGPGGRPGVPPWGHRRAVVPPQPLREGPPRRNPRRGVVPGIHRRGEQRPARRDLVRGLAARSRPGLAPYARSGTQLQVGRAALLAPVRVGLPAARLQVVPGGDAIRRSAGR